MTEGYIYTTYGKPDYLHHALASVVTLRRYDRTRPVALYCSDAHRELLRSHGLASWFQRIDRLPDEHASIVGVKHHLEKFMCFDANLFLDSDMIWCRDPDTLWKSFSAYRFTVTGQLVADPFFGASKGIGVLADIVLRRRRRTLKRLGVTQLSRVQSGMMYAADRELAQRVCREAREMLARRGETHFRSRLEEKGRTEETCEWSLGLAMARLHLAVHPWFQGYSSPQLDYLSAFTRHDPDFENVECLYYADEKVYALRGLRRRGFRNFLIRAYSLWSGRGDHMWVTPYTVHFGWLHDKQPFYDFARRTWEQLTAAP
jgi:hypothetical protein